MKKTLSLLLTAVLLFGLPGMSAAAADDLDFDNGTEGTIEERFAFVPVSDYSGISFTTNENANYIRGVGMSNIPYSSYILDRDDGITVCRYGWQERNNGVTVRDFMVLDLDRDGKFVSGRKLPVDYTKFAWGDFCRTADAYYLALVYAKSRIVILRYDLDWQLSAWNSYTVPNTKSLPHNDFEMIAWNGSLFIATNHTMTSGHQADMRYEINAGTLAVIKRQTGEADFQGYFSHDYVPEIVHSGKYLYTFDRCDSFPGEAIYMCMFEGHLENDVRMLTVCSASWQDWGNIGGAAPLAENGVLMAYSYASQNKTSGDCTVKLYRYDPDLTEGYPSGTVTVPGSDGAGIPMLAAFDEKSGFVLWNHDLYASSDWSTLYAAPYSYENGELTIGAVREYADCPLTDCRPILTEGGIAWFSTASGSKTTVHQLDRTGEMTDIRLYETNHVHVPAARPAVSSTCCTHGHTAGHQCSACGEILDGMEELPFGDHDFRRVESGDCMVEATMQTDAQALYQCRDCGLTEWRILPGTRGAAVFEAPGISTANEICWRYTLNAAVQANCHEVRFWCVFYDGAGRFVTAETRTMDVTATAGTVGQAVRTDLSGIPRNAVSCRAYMLTPEGCPIGDAQLVSLAALREGRS